MPIRGPDCLPFDIDGSLTRVGEMLQKPEDVRELLLGKS